MISSRSVSAIFSFQLPASSLRPAASGSRLRVDLLDAALHVEVPFGHLVVLAVEDFLEALDGIGHRHLTALAAREDLRRAERLAEETLNPSRPVDGQLVFRRQFVHAKNGD